VINEPDLKGYGHGGGSIGGITLFDVYPEKGLVMAVLSNSSDVEYGNAMARIVKLFLKVK
jgi:serine beta-lactamase-like protein LACTB, mitochondrial